MPSTRWTGDDMESYWRRGMGGPTTTEWPTADAMAMINAAANELAAEYGEGLAVLEATEDITTVASQAEYELAATDILAIRHLTSSFYPRLKPKNRDYQVRLGTTTAANPWGWFLSGGSNDGAWNVSLVGTPSVAGKTVTVYYSKMVPEILQGTEVNSSVLPQIWDLSIVRLAVMIGLSLGTQPKAAKLQGPFVSDSARRAAKTITTSEHLWKLGGFEWINGRRS